MSRELSSVVGLVGLSSLGLAAVLMAVSCKHEKQDDYYWRNTGAMPSTDTNAVTLIAVTNYSQWEMRPALRPGTAFNLGTLIQLTSLEKGYYMEWAGSTYDKGGPAVFVTSGAFRATNDGSCLLIYISSERYKELSNWIAGWIGLHPDLKTKDGWKYKP